jgi:Flp pilus assembly protein TadB
MAIDGRDIAKARAAAEGGRAVTPPARDHDAYESPAIRLLSHALIWIPLGLIVVLAYVSGTWIGDWTTGVINVVATVLTFGGIWLWRRLRRRRH